MSRRLLLTAAGWLAYCCAAGCCSSPYGSHWGGQCQPQCCCAPAGTYAGTAYYNGESNGQLAEPTPAVGPLSAEGVASAPRAKLRQ